MKIVIRTKGEKSSGKLEQAVGHLANNILDAEEEAIVVLLKMIYKFDTPSDP